MVGDSLLKRLLHCQWDSLEGVPMDTPNLYEQCHVSYINKDQYTNYTLWYDTETSFSNMVQQTIVFRVFFGSYVLC